MKRFLTMLAASGAVVIGVNAPAQAAAYGYYNARTLDSAIRHGLDHRLSKYSTHVTEVRCVIQSRTQAACYVKFSDGEQGGYKVEIGDGGGSFLVVGTL